MPFLVFLEHVDLRWALQATSHLPGGKFTATVKGATKKFRLAAPGLPGECDGFFVWGFGIFSWWSNGLLEVFLLFAMFLDVQTLTACFCPCFFFSHQRNVA